MSLLTIRSGATAMTEAPFLQFVTDFLQTSGVFDIATGTQLKVSAGTGLSVDIDVGRAYILKSGGNGYPVINDAEITNLAVTANSSGNPRYTSTVLYIDLGASPNAAASNVAIIANVDGTPAASPTPPDSTAILAAIGAGNPYIVLANVLVNSGASVPTAIYDVRPQAKFRSDIFTADNWVVLQDAATITLDLSLGKKFWIQGITADRAIALLNVPKNCKSILVRITQNSSGNHTPSFWSGLSWANGGVAPVFSGANKSDELEFNFLTVTDDSTNTSEGFVVGQDI